MAKARHEKEREEVNSLVKSVSEAGGSYKVTARGPAKIITRVKGIKPGIKIIPEPTPGSVTIRTKDSARVTTRVPNVVSNLKRKNEPQTEEQENPQNQPLEQAPPQNLTLKESKDQPLKQSSPRIQSRDQSGQRQTASRSPQGRQLDQSPKRRTPDQSPQQPLLEQPPQSRTTVKPRPGASQSPRRAQSPAREPPVQAVQRRALQRQPERQFLQNTPVELIEQSYQNQPPGQQKEFRDTPYQNETLEPPYEAQLDGSAFERDDSPSAEFTSREGRPKSPKMNLDITASEDIRIQLQVMLFYICHIFYIY